MFFKLFLDNIGGKEELGEPIPGKTSVFLVEGIT